MLHGPALADNAPYVICDGCEIQTAYCDTEAEAIDTWNRRVTTGPITDTDIAKWLDYLKSIQTMDRNWKFDVTSTAK